MRVGSTVALAVFAACAFSALAYIRIPQKACPEPSARSIPMLFAPCQAYGAAKDAANVRQALREFRGQAEKVIASTP